MNEINLVFEGGKFMVLGMSVVFAFLFLLVQIINLQKFILDWLLEPEIPVIANETENEKAEIVAAIMGALRIHRRKDKQHE
jgi:oxaloacetate decarboxylase gamma subunit